MTIYGYGVNLDRLFDDLDLEWSGTQEDAVKAADIELMHHLTHYSSALENAVDNANNNLEENNQPLLKVAIYRDIIDEPSYLYYPAIMPFEKEKIYSKEILTRNIKESIADMIWSEYSANLKDSHYPIDEDFFIKHTIENIPDSKIKVIDPDL